MIMFATVFFLMFGFAAFTYGMIKTIEKVVEIEYYIQKINLRLDEHEKKMVKE